MYIAAIGDAIVAEILLKHKADLEVQEEVKMKHTHQIPR